MDKSKGACSEADLAFDEVLLSDSAFETDPSKILVGASDLQKLRFRPIEWLAAAPNRKVKAERKQQIATTLDVSTRQIERLLDRYNDARLHETVGIERSDKGQHRIGDYWPEYVRSVYEQSLKDKHPLNRNSIHQSMSFRSRGMSVDCRYSTSSLMAARIWQDRSSSKLLGKSSGFSAN